MLNPRLKFWTLAIGFILSFSLSCSSGPPLPPGVSPSEIDLESSENIKTLVIFGINDFHGALAPTQYQSRDKAPVAYETGGAAMLAGHIRSLRRQFGDDLLVLDAGDQWQGTLDSNLLEGAPVIDFYNSIGVDAAVLGNHEFDFGPIGPQVRAETGQDPFETLKLRLQQAEFPFVASNIFYKKTSRPFQVPNLFQEILIEREGIQIGIIGLTTISTPSTTIPTNVASLSFGDLKTATLRQAQSLRAKGADLIIALAHAGLVCRRLKSETLADDYDIWRNNTPQGACDQDGEIVRLLNEIPQGTVDAVLAGHTHQIIHHWINGTPVVQSGAYGRYFHLLYLPYDREKKKLLANAVRIEGPVPVCKKVFKNQKNCNGRQVPPPEGRGNLTEPRFHGSFVRPDSNVQDLLRLTFEKNRAAKDRIVGEAARPVKRSRVKESEFGNLIADAIRKQTGSDFAIVNPGLIRMELDQGPVTYEELFRALPFNNKISVLKIKGHELKRILRVANCGARGFFPSAGLKISVIDLPYGAPATDLDGSGEIQHWEVNRILDIRTSQGKRIQTHRTYTLATIDFLVDGGDDMGWVMGRIPESRIQRDSLGIFIRDAVARYIGEIGPINRLEAPLINSAQPRLILRRSKKWRSRGWSWR